MIRAIIFDCFGVLTTEGWLPFKKKYFGHDAALEQEATDLSARLNRGQLDYETFAHEVAELAHVSKEEVVAAIHRNVPNEELFEYLRTRLKPRFKLGILSNAGSDRLFELFTPEQAALFDNASLSFQTGHVKPESAAYEEAAAAFDVPINQCVFVDDQERHCAGARHAGMQAIQYRDFEQFKSELETLLGDLKD